MDEVLTGNIRHRTNWAGKLILQVEVDRHYADMYGGIDVRVWRDASPEDVLTGDIKVGTRTISE